MLKQYIQSKPYYLLLEAINVAQEVVQYSSVWRHCRRHFERVNNDENSNNKHPNFNARSNDLLVLLTRRHCSMMTSFRCWRFEWDLHASHYVFMDSCTSCLYHTILTYWYLARHFGVMTIHQPVSRSVWRHWTERQWRTIETKSSINGMIHTSELSDSHDLHWYIHVCSFSATIIANKCTCMWFNTIIQSCMYKPYIPCSTWKKNVVWCCIVKIYLLLCWLSFRYI